MLTGRDRGDFQARAVPPPHSPGTGPVPSGAAQRCPGEGAPGVTGVGGAKGARAAAPDGASNGEGGQ